MSLRATRSNLVRIPDHLGWTVDLSKSVETIIYPSLLKKIQKSEEKFKEFVTVKNIKVTQKFFEEEFLPIYIDEIATREDFHLDLQDQEKKILENIKDGKKYFCFAAIIKTLFVGGTLYFIENGKASVSLRAFERDINKRYKFKTTIDYWMEKKILDHLKNEGLENLMHGSDHHPRYINIGLPLFKLKIGGHPRISTHDFEYINLDISKLKDDQLPALFFSNENPDGFFTKMTIATNGKNINESLINEYRVVCKWAGLDFEEIKI